jgi:hypothetical protein
MLPRGVWIFFPLAFGNWTLRKETDILHPATHARRKITKQPCVGKSRGQQVNVFSFTLQASDAAWNRRWKNIWLLRIRRRIRVDPWPGGCRVHIAWSTPHYPMTLLLDEMSFLLLYHIETIEIRRLTLMPRPIPEITCLEWYYNLKEDPWIVKYWNEAHEMNANHNGRSGNIPSRRKRDQPDRDGVIESEIG